MPSCAIADAVVRFDLIPINSRYTCNGTATFSDGTTEKHAVCENNNGTMQWSDIGDECNTSKEIGRPIHSGSGKGCIFICSTKLISMINMTNYVSSMPNESIEKLTFALFVHVSNLCVKNQ